MKHPIDTKSFDDISETFSTWIIKYRSKTYEEPLYLIWYTDTDPNRTDKLLTFTTGQIFATGSLSGIRNIIIEKLTSLQEFENLPKWLDSIKNLEPIESCIYDVKEINDAIENNILEIKTIEALMDFINLFDDFIRQSETNSYLQAYRDNELLEKAWEYSYNYIFWPKFNDKNKFDKWERPGLEIDYNKLLEAFSQMRRQFEAKIYVVLE